MQEIDILLSIAERSGQYGEVQISTSELAGELEVSQQTISNQFRKLEAKSLINRQPTYFGTSISLTPEGLDVLRDYAQRIQTISKSIHRIKGILYTGLGEGRFYTSVPRYRQQFVEKLSIDPFLGTLNLRVDPIEKKKFLNDKKQLHIRGFSSMKRMFGPLKAYPVKIDKLKCAALIPERTIHRDTIEVISEHNLRTKLHIEDGDEVMLRSR